MKIGIPAGSSKTQYYINKAYIDYVEETDGLDPVIIMPCMDLKKIVDSIDGLILPGGIDIDPTFYGYDNMSSFSVDPEKDGFERELLHLCKNLGKPVFGICRGFQLIVREYMHENIEADRLMYFIEHISSHNQVDNQNLARSTHQHFVDFIPEELYSKEVQVDSNYVDSTAVNSMHHQCVIVNKNRKIGKDAVVVAWTDRGLKKDDKNSVICEAIKINNWGAPILGVQWHPEELKDTFIIETFFKNNLKSKIINKTMEK